MSSRSQLGQSGAPLEWREGWRATLAILCAAVTIFALIWLTPIHDSESLTLIAGINIGMLLLAAPGPLALRWDRPGELLLWSAFGFSLFLFMIAILSVGLPLAVPVLFALLGIITWPRNAEGPSSTAAMLIAEISGFLFLPVVIGLTSLLVWLLPD